ncbi:MAG: hypothetical protein ACP5PT_06310 [Brevinematia bacterium]|jgi:uncharacterized membrane protein YGL010W
MFIKDIVLGVLGLFAFSIAEIFIKNTYFTLYGLVFSASLVLFYFVNVYVMAKRRTFLLSLASWLIILSILYPFSFITHGAYSELKSALSYVGLASFSLSWLIVFIELFASKTFKGY